MKGRGESGPVEYSVASTPAPLRKEGNPGRKLRGT